ncbi:hypothetical protein [Curvivirga sp.]|uniref:hypothetical protein n=1 Tax=Curvivirga sp. TaxID=2856848 RepID=UPI003B5B76FF
MDAGQQLQMLITSLSEKELKKLAAKVELDRGANKLGLPHNAIMQLLRPSLALIRAERVHTPQRIFCLPFEDMLVNGKPDPKPTGHIDRSTIQPMWVWFTKELAKDTYPSLAKEYTDAQREGDDEATLEAAKALWAHGASLMSDALKSVNVNDKAMREMAKKFGGENRLNDVIEMAGCLRIAPFLEHAKSEMRAKPIHDLAEPEILAAKRGYTEIADEVPGDEVYFLLAITARLLRPSSIFQILRTLSRKGDDAMLQKTDIGVVGKIAIDELEETAGKVKRSSAKGEFNEAAVVEDIYFFAQGFKEVTDNMGITRDGEWGQRMFKARAQVSEAIDVKFLRDAEQRIMRALPTKSGGLVPKLAEMPNDHDFEVAERRAQAIHDINAISKQLGNQSNCLAIISKLEKHFENYTTGLLKALPKAPEDLIPTAYAYVHIASRLMELIVGPDEADLLRRRGNAALKNTMVD